MMVRSQRDPIFGFCFAHWGCDWETNMMECLFCHCAAEQMFWEVMRLRREMSVAKLGFYLTDQG